MGQKTDIGAFVEHLPWLREIGEETLARLDSSVWLLPSEEVAREKSRMEQAHIMTYRKSTGGMPDGLAQVVRPATLSDAEIALLRQAESADGCDCLMVAYARPLEIQRPERARRENARRDNARRATQR